MDYTYFPETNCTPIWNNWFEERRAFWDKMQTGFESMLERQRYQDMIDEAIRAGKKEVHLKCQNGNGVYRNIPDVPKYMNVYLC